MRLEIQRRPIGGWTIENVSSEFPVKVANLFVSTDDKQLFIVVDGEIAIRIHVKITFSILKTEHQDTGARPDVEFNQGLADKLRLARAVDHLQVEVELSPAGHRARWGGSLCLPRQSPAS